MVAAFVDADDPDALTGTCTQSADRAIAGEGMHDAVQTQGMDQGDRAQWRVVRGQCVLFIGLAMALGAGATARPFALDLSQS